jgi:hypothetical protein
MKTLLSVLLVALLVSLFVPSSAFASQATPLGGCPISFDLHPFMDHTGEQMHTHIGVDRDLNSDGYICMKMLPNDLHLHVDNTYAIQ